MIKTLLSVVVCTHNRAGLLKKCLGSLVAQTLDPNMYEIIVVDNSSTDRTQDIVEEFRQRQPNMRGVLEPIIGLSPARNRGWKEAAGKYIAYIDDDARAASDWCEKILKAFTTVSPAPVAVGGKIQPLYETDPPIWFTDDLETRSWGESAGFLKPPGAKYGFSGSNMALQRDIFKRHEGFNPCFGVRGNRLGFGEEPELFMRIYEKEPYFWYDPEIRVYHWTTKRHFRFTYNFRRSYLIGVKDATLDGRKIFTFQYLRKWASLFKYTVKASLLLISGPGKMKTKLLKTTRELGVSLGYLVGRKI